MVVGNFPPLSFSLYNFAIQESTLKTAHRDFLADLASWISGSSSGITVSVAGHADSTGDAEINEPLSLDRGQAVVDFLTAQGLAVGPAQSFGAARPVASNETETGRARNRRVDLIVYIAESRPEPEPDEPEPPDVVPPEGTLPPGGEIDSTWFCTEHPWVCAALGAGTAVAIFCILFPEVCAAIGWPDWPDWPDWPWDDDEEPDEEDGEEEEPDCGDPELPETHVEYIPATGDKGNALEAKPLTVCPGNTTGSEAKNTDPDWPYGWTCVDVAGEGNRWVRAHLLHSDLHGPGDDRRNIIISDKSINGLMYLRIERNAIEEVWTNRRVLYYRVEVTHMTGAYPRPYFAERVDMEYGELDPITGVESSPLGTASITSRVGHQPPPCVSTPEEDPDEPEPGNEPVTEPEEEPPEYRGPTIGPAPEGVTPRETSVVDDCGAISCLAMDHYRENVGHFRDDVFVVTADERIVREMIRREMRFLRATRFAGEYRLLELDRIRDPPGHLQRRAVLDGRVETEARRRVFDFLVNHSGDPTWSLKQRLTVEGLVRSDYARLR